ncbi:hypothetical protein NEOLI_003189 [Neolecta irregularis DAH-3]|uniref:Uncharacterized protein n=1 Tax=Neolecta irregularis (strain DAH-3) TaxID=1198029 RepID=A0A1U7LN32_NEOID|nr:hypothetical protein NEOLI_003189 [Neolecta irregularis DAH-3]|eukprot:OLL24076.1 hypothetical protein NEOLI_003189 [Neolecta irregularis DAH-3]
MTDIVDHEIRFGLGLRAKELPAVALIFRYMIIQISILATGAQVVVLINEEGFTVAVFGWADFVLRQRLISSLSCFCVDHDGLGT